MIIPADVQELDYTPPEHAFKMVPSSLGLALPHVVPPEPELRRAADVLNAGSRVAVLVGQGARGAAREVTEVAELLGAGVAKALLGKDALPDDLPFVTGSVGLLGTRPSYELMAGCDTLLTVGSNFPYTQFMPEFDQARAVQIDLDATFIGMRYPYEVNLVGHAATTLRQLIPLLQRKTDRRGASRSRRTSPAGGRSWSGGPPRTQTRSTRCASSPSSRRGSRPTSSSPPTPGRRRTGTRATWSSARACAGRCPAPWRPWVPGCPT